MRLAFHTLLICLLAPVAWCQYLISVRAGWITHAEGALSLDGESFRYSPDMKKELGAGQSLQTGAGRAEIQLGPYGSLWLDEQGSLRMVHPPLTDIELRLEKGSAMVEVIEDCEEGPIRVHLDTATVKLREAGLYRISRTPPRLYVFRGKAAAEANRTACTAKGGMMVDLGNIEASRFEPERTDAFYDWTLQRSAVVYGPVKHLRAQERFRRQLENSRLEQMIQWELARQQIQRLQEEMQARIRQQQESQVPR